MPTENTRLIYRWFEEIWNQQRADLIDEWMEPDVIAHGLGDRAADLHGIESFREFHRQFTGAFPDLRIKVEEVLAEGDLSACRFTGTGTHRGDHLGLAPTGNAVTFTGMTFTRWRDGRIVEGWNNVDIPGIFAQISDTASGPRRQ